MNQQHPVRQRQGYFGLSVFASIFLLSGCALTPSGSAPRAVADLAATRGHTATGHFEFVQQGERVLITGQVSGLKPGAEHGFHIHEKGDCSSGDGVSTGGHFNPLGKPHAHGSPERHVGDMPAIKADANGDATYRAELDVMTVTPGAASIVGKGLIVHRDPDDYKTQPTGNAGPRIACAVIRAE